MYYRSTVQGDGHISAKVVEDSIANDVRLTTFEVRYPRFIHAELMTHRMFSRNASSSRAIPVDTFIKAVEEQPAMPIHWGKNQAGMQADEELDSTYGKTAWLGAMRFAVGMAHVLNKLGFHKQIVNRITEPFHFITVVITATEYDNFFALRDHKDAQPEIHELAIRMKQALGGSDPVMLQPGEWHLPYITRDERASYKDTLLAKVSGGRCARTSYLNHDKSDPVVDDDICLYHMLVTRPFANAKGTWLNSDPIHASPVEHQAMVATHTDGETWPHGATHIDRLGTLWSGNLRGPFMQLRQML